MKATTSRENIDAFESAMLQLQGTLRDFLVQSNQAQSNQGNFDYVMTQVTLCLDNPPRPKASERTRIRKDVFQKYDKDGSKITR
jgi:hypothetical protein